MCRKKNKKITGKLIYIGIGLLFTGFIVLYLANRKADNWAGYLAPLLLVAGWIMIGAGLWKLDEER